MADQLLNLIITTTEPFEPVFCEWFSKQIKTNSSCTLEEFGLFFLNFIRQQTEEYTRTPGTPKCVGSPVSKPTIRRDTSATRTPNRIFPNNSQQQLTPDNRFRGDDSFQLRCTPTRNTSLFNENLNQSNHKGFTSTPHKSLNKSNGGNNSNEFNRSSNSSGFCLGDFIVSNSRTRKKQQQKESPANISDGNSSDNKTKNKTEKPKKRVVPTQVSKTPVAAAHSFSSPTLSSENNILKIFNDAEIVDKGKCSVMAARKSLKSNILEISKELEEENRPNLINQSLREAVKRMEKLNMETDGEGATEEEPKIDFNKLTHRRTLDCLAELYSFLIDVHITANVLSELSYLLGILNADNNSSSGQSLTSQFSTDLEFHLDDKLNVINRTNNEAYTALKTPTNCIYFSLEVLKRQKHLLALLDVKTLRVVLNNDRISDLAADLKDFLEKIVFEKQQLEVKKSSYEASFRISKTFNNVFYQQENDTKNNFPNDREFGNFKSQRDQFYTIFKCWDANHFNHTWNFRMELQTKIQILFNISDHPINMAHLAKLFVSQLLISSNYNETSPTDIGVELKAHVDLQKFSKLTQRLVEPSNFSSDYQFPAKQAFFKDFLLVSSCVAFSEQVKIALLAELVQLNSSTYEVINLTPNDSTDFVMEYVVRPEVLSTMQVLAKFLGLLHAQPFLYPPSSGCLSIDKKQIELRNMVQPGFDVMGLLKAAVSERKLLITIPWIVQYLAMLDHITLQLDYYRNVLHLLYELYIYLGGRSDLLRMRQTSVFILQTCLGWFFEGTNVAESYYAYRQNGTQSFSQLIEMKEISVLVPNALVSELAHNEEKPMVVTSIKKEIKEGVVVSLNRCEKVQDVDFNEYTVERTVGQFDPMLEGILNVACPFLSEFRVTIMPLKYSKCVSRSGRYRHVTPKISEITNSQSPKQQPKQDSQSKLIEAFLHSQSLSVRRIIEFVIERTTSAVIKDAQIEILLPSKNEANKKVQEEVRSTDTLKVKKEILQIYSQANDAAIAQWNCELPFMVESRVKMALDALLPHETPEVVKTTCLSLVLQKCQLKINDWRTTNLKNIDFYIKGIDVTVDKIVKSNMLKHKPLSTNLEIIVSTPCLSDILEDLQFWMHASSRRPELVEVGKIKMFLEELQKTFDNILPQSFYRIIGSSVVHLMQNLIENHSNIVSRDLIKSFTAIWAVEGMNAFTQWNCTSSSKKSINSKQNSSEEEDTSSEKQNIMSTNLFSSLITISFVRSLKTDESFNKLELLLLELIENNVITIDHLNELFVRIFKVEWNEQIFSRISALLQTVSGRRNKKLKEDDGRSNLFMEVLADFSRDIDSF